MASIVQWVGDIHLVPEDAMKKLTTALIISSLFSLNAIAQELPNITILGTGGTIAGSAEKSTDVTGYKAGEIAVSTLIEAVPQIVDVANVDGIQVANTSSSNIDSKILLEMANTANSLLQNDTSGVVITHGTDTTEETAFFMDLVNQTDKPIVVVGAMRPATAISADGPMNLLNAVKLASDESAYGRGTMVLLNDNIGAAYYTSKTSSISLDTFKAHDQGFLGTFAGGEPKFYYEPAKVMGKPTFDVSKLETLPKVDIVYSYQNMGPEIIDAIVESGADGIVVAGSGNGSVPSAVRERISQLNEDGYPVVLSTRTGSGFVTAKSHAIGSGVLNPQKARIMLMLALTETQDVKELPVYFGTQS
ncbi:L-asparaginase [Vibrio breoganii]|nr:L-asparaginase [Vibrio breoganii]PMM12086.1 L-asparaginase [Vibrio breoganii]TKG21117.1 type II asparaginase [Vibrio breoganii]